MAEGLLRSIAGGCYEIFSAGTKPVGLNPLAVEAMREIGVDISTHKSKNVTQFLGEPMDYVVTVCDNASETCPLFASVFRTLHWSFEDPVAAHGTHEEKLAEFRRIRDQIRARIEAEFAK
jgi:arsenate reductase